MDFREATERAKAASITLADIATAAGVSHNGVRRARLDPKAGDSYRSPPIGWEAALAKLARERARALLNLAAELQGRASAERPVHDMSGNMRATRAKNC